MKICSSPADFMMWMWMELKGFWKADSCRRHRRNMSHNYRFSQMAGRMLKSKRLDRKKGELEEDIFYFQNASADWFPVCMTMKCSETNWEWNFPSTLIWHLAVVVVILFGTRALERRGNETKPKRKKISVRRVQIVNIFSSQWKACRSFKAHFKLRKQRQLWLHSKRQKMYFFLFICKKCDINNQKRAFLFGSKWQIMTKAGCQNASQRFLLRHNDNFSQKRHFVV